MHVADASVAGPVGHSWAVRLSHASSQIRIEEPFPTTHPMFSLSKSLLSRIPRHPWEVVVFCVTAMELSEGQYFPIKILDSKSSGLLSILLLNLPRKASLKAWKSLNSKPLISFGYVIFSYEIHAILFRPSWSSHQNIVTADWICLHKEIGSLKQLIAVTEWERAYSWS